MLPAVVDSAVKLPVELCVMITEFAMEKAQQFEHVFTIGDVELSVMFYYETIRVQTDKFAAHYRPHHPVLYMIYGGCDAFVVGRYRTEWIQFGLSAYGSPTITQLKTLDYEIRLGASAHEARLCFEHLDRVVKLKDDIVRLKVGSVHHRHAWRGNVDLDLQWPQPSHYVLNGVIEQLDDKSVSEITMYHGDGEICIVEDRYVHIHGKTIRRCKLSFIPTTVQFAESCVRFSNDTCMCIV